MMPGLNWHVSIRQSTLDMTLGRRNVIELSHDRFAYDVDRLVHAIGGSYGTMIVSLGTTYLSPISVHARFLDSMEVFEVYVDRKRVGKIEGPGFSFEREKSKKVSWLPVAVRVGEGVHNVFIKKGNRRFERYPLLEKSNELSFKIRGGQSIAFTIDCETSSIGASQLVLKSHKPIIEP